MHFVRMNGVSEPWSLCGTKAEFHLFRQALEHILGEGESISQEEVQLLEEFLAVTIDTK